MGQVSLWIIPDPYKEIILGVLAIGTKGGGETI